jgi:Dynein heavy chain, N-terminal region 2/Dynein heavy chain, N-terminal region 1
MYRLCNISSLTSVSTVPICVLYTSPQVKYFLLLGLDVPAATLAIHEKGEIFRIHKGALELIVQQYNAAQASMLPVERALLKHHIDKVDNILSQAQDVAHSNTSSNHSDSNSVVVNSNSALLSLSSSRSTFKTSNSSIGSGSTSHSGHTATDKSMHINWRSTSIDSFITEAAAEVQNMCSILHSLKANVKRIESLLTRWQASPLFERTTKTATVSQFSQHQKRVVASRCHDIREGGNDVHKLMKDTNRILKVSQGLPDWTNYVEYINSIVIAGLTKVVTTSLMSLDQQLDSVYVLQHQLPPLLEVEMHLHESNVIFIPELGSIDIECTPNGIQAADTLDDIITSLNSSSSDAAGTTHDGITTTATTTTTTATEATGATTANATAASVSSAMVAHITLRSLVKQWVDGFMLCGKAFKRLDSADGTYIKEIQYDPLVSTLVSSIEQRLALAETDAIALKKHFSVYSALWTTDLHSTFADFMRDATYTEILSSNSSASSVSSTATTTGAVTAGGVAKDSSAIAQSVTLLNLTMFDEKIRYYLTMQDEVSHLRHQHDMDFIRINSQPIKQAISTCVNKWLFQFTNQLQDHVSVSIDRMQSFMTDTATCLDTYCNLNDDTDDTVDDNNSKHSSSSNRHNSAGTVRAKRSSSSKGAVMEVLTHIRNVRKRSQEVTSMFGPLKNTVLLLKDRGIAMDLTPINGQNTVDYLNEAPHVWDSIVNKAAKVKLQVEPLQHVLSNDVMTSIEHLNTEIREFHAHFWSVAPIASITCSSVNSTDNSSNSSSNTFYKTADISCTKAYATLQELALSLQLLHDKAEHMIDLIELLDIPSLDVQQHTATLLNEMQQGLCNMKLVWDTFAIINYTIVHWATILWHDVSVHIEQLLHESKEFLTQWYNLPQCVHAWDMYTITLQHISDVHNVLLAVQLLQSKAIRTRHWKALLDMISNECKQLGVHSLAAISPYAIAATLNIITSDTCCLGDIFQLYLHRHISAVKQVLEIAEKESKIKEQFVKIEQYWAASSLQFFKLTVHRVSANDQNTATSDEAAHQTHLTLLTVEHTHEYILPTLEDHQLQLQYMAGIVSGSSSSVSDSSNQGFRDAVQTLLLQLGEAYTCIQLLLRVQKQWLMIRPMFTVSSAYNDGEQHTSSLHNSKDNVNTDNSDSIATKFAVVDSDMTSILHAIAGSVTAAATSRATSVTTSVHGNSDSNSNSNSNGILTALSRAASGVTYVDSASNDIHGNKVQ